MRRVFTYALGVVAVFVCVAVALFEYSYYADQQRFRAAENDCERGCIRDSGGFPQCREVCAGHPDHYP
jgi:hypothetical protein